ncbi:MAG TPA: alpha/beta fold hydrolase [Pyrinomonadaceae bacterium]|nr:alpha/beta fold hydrolase [Pyrinomonadaceae bacterium]
MGEMVQFPLNGGTTNGYLAISRHGSGPGVIVLQEWWGLVDHIKDVCDRFANEGFTALAPDLYHGKATKSPDEAGKLMMALNIDQAEKDVGAAIKYLQSLDSVTSTSASRKVGVIGFCMGGALALYTTMKNKNIDACIVFYGIHPNVNFYKLTELNAPVLGNFAENDSSVPPDDVRKLEHFLKIFRKPINFKIYPGADHAFFNDTRPEVYNAAAAADAWTRTLAFLSRYMPA